MVIPLGRKRRIPAPTAGNLKRITRLNPAMSALQNPHDLTNLPSRGEAASSCAEHDRQLGGESPLSNLMEVKD